MKTVRVISGTIALLLISQFLVGCASKETEARDAVKGYNKALEKAYLNADYMDLRKTATLEEQQKVGQKLGELLAQNKTMRSKLEKIKFNKVELTKGRASVSTEETWVYELIDGNTQKPSPRQKTYYEVIYSVVEKKSKNNPVWLVEGVTVQKELQL